MSYVQGYMQAVSATLANLPWEQIERAIDVLHEARLRRAQVFVCGNGGSAATASHMVNDLNKGANVEGMPRFRAIGLTDNVPLLTALSNDISYADALAEQLRNLARPGMCWWALAAAATRLMC
jgi:D-sedoheptulose 7-phosphate isomerase